MPFILLTAERDPKKRRKKKKKGEAKLSFDPGGEYINMEIKYCLGIPKYITELEMQTASYDTYFKKISMQLIM